MITKEVSNFIKENYLKMPGSKIAEKFDLDKGVVYRYLKRNKLQVPRDLIVKWRSEATKRPITSAEKKYITENIQEKSIKQISKELHRTSAHISRAAHELGFTDLIEKKRIESTFNKGHVPSNKGKTWDEMGIDIETRERMLSTAFKVGNEPHNTLYDGAITLRHDHPHRNGGRKYYYIRLSKGESMPLHRYIWIQEHGSIPKGMNVVFKDGNSLNCKLDNLEIISKSKNMKRNTIHNYPEELKKNIRLVKKIEKTINSKIKDDE
ncbi:HNH endonuclease signature motif containing protein [Sediminibacter sp. Hel_I_10]|uniref:HNH endonuclease signature motif containing protein n=1 Tax=Sediminibacter sp. Hel_I_10 TaxID=1392490 RepID=UPI00068BD89A|nr:HNH endonuclease signature motif containing protein [Sediminibacter sp. Hel_I_10]